VPASLGKLRAPIANYHRTYKVYYEVIDYTKMLQEAKKGHGSTSAE
jgi:hypothetical protein